MTDEYYIKQHGMTREEYFHDNYNEVSCLTAKCLRNKSESWVYEDYSELEIGKTYKVTHIGMTLGTGTLSASKHQTIEQEAKAFMI